MSEQKNSIKELGKVFYFDPNNTKVDIKGGDNLTAIFGGKELINPPEDYSIAIDLEVTSKSRNNVTLNEKGTTTNYSMESTNGVANFLQGAKLGPEGKTSNVLTSFFSDISYEGDDTAVQNEGMCINSIDIEFSSWYVASVIIKFTDVRGSSLFSPTENLATDNATQKVSNSNLYSGFFTMPYPIFKLKVKGIYGDAVTYPLHCQDFKAEYDSNKGNFNITAQFIGYTYAMLSDVQMTYILAAPYCKMYGEQYWNDQVGVNDGRFRTLEGTPLPRVPDLMKKIIAGESVVSNLDTSNVNMVNLREKQKATDSIKVIKSQIDDYKNWYVTNYKVLEKPSYNLSINIDSNSDYKKISPTMDFDATATSKITSLGKLINEFNNTYTGDTIFLDYKYDSVNKKDKATEYFYVKTKNNSVSTSGTLDLSKIIEKIDMHISTNTNELNDLGKKTAQTINNSLTETYQMKPSIYNFTKMLLAHMETLLYIIGRCAYDINKNGDRGVATGNQSTDILENKFSPFPWFTVNETGKNFEDGWIGRYHPDFLEVKLVKELLKAKIEITQEIQKLENQIATSDIGEDTVTATVGDIWFPMNAFDNSINIIGGNKKAPYSNLIKECGVSVDELKAILSTRIAMIVGLSADLDSSHPTYNGFISGETKNIIDQLGISSRYLENVVTALNNIKSDKSKNDDYTLLKDYRAKIDGNSETMVSYEYNFLNTNGILPLTNDTIAKFKSSNSVKDGKITNSFKYYRDGSGMPGGVAFNNTTNYAKYPNTSVTITTASGDCDKIYNDWYLKVLNNVGNSADLSNILYRILLRKENSAQAISNLDYPQSMFNKIGHIKPDYTESSKSLYLNSGYYFNETINNEISTGDTNKNIIIGLNFGTLNNKGENFYKLYSGKNSLSELSSSSIKELNRSEMFLKASPDSNLLTYPLIGGKFISDRGLLADIGINIKNWFIDTFKVVGSNKQETSFETITCLFGHPVYYAQNNFTKRAGVPTDALAFAEARRAKSFLFLQTLPVNITSINSNLINNDNLDRSFMIRMPKAESLLLGSMLWRKKTGGRTIFSGGFLPTPSPDYSHYYRVNGLFTITNKNEDYDVCEIVNEMDVNSELSKQLINLFIKWADDFTSIDGWGRIENAFEFFMPGSTSTSRKHMNEIRFKKFAEGFYTNHDVDYLKKYTSSNVINNYSIVEPINAYTIGLVNRDKTDGIKSILNLLFNENIISYTGDGFLSAIKETSSGFTHGRATNLTTLKEENVNLIIDGIKSKIQSQLKTMTNVTSKLPDQTTDSANPYAAVDNEDINLQLYGYLKTLYDKWVSGYEFETINSGYKWIDQTKTKLNGFDTYDFSTFKFIDRAYNNIGDKFIIDFKDTINNMIGLTEQKTLYTTITDVLAKNQFLFLPMPNYQSWKTADEFAKIFKPIPYIESNITHNNNNNDWDSIFVCMYTGAPSKNLNVTSSEYQFQDDALSLNISKDSNIPGDFSSENENDIQNTGVNMQKVPAFAVSNGKQNQSYFKNITLNQNNPATTDASIGVLKSLSENADSKAKVSTITQNLYTLYSKFSYTCDVEMLGCAQIQPMMYFELTNVPMWNGSYLIYKVNHSIRPGTMTTSFSGMRMSKDYPKLLQPAFISADDMNTSFSVAPISKSISTLSKDTKFGYFKLADYTKNESQIPEYIVSRLRNNVAPTIDNIYDSWMASEVQKTNNYGPFIITNGYRNPVHNAAVGGVKDSAHVQGLAADIQLKNKNSATANDALFEHVKSRMKQGLKMDQVIKEPSTNGGLVHISPIWTDNVNVQVRGNYIVQNDSRRTIESLSGTIEEAKGTGKLLSPLSINNEFMSYWKEAENSTSKGFNKIQNKWYAHKSVEGGDPTIAYGIKLSYGFLQSDEMKCLNLAQLQDGVIGITEETAINEILTKINSAMSDISKIIKKKNGDINNIKERYRYGLVDVYLNTGGGNFKKQKWSPFIESAMANNVEGMINNDIRDSKQRKNLLAEYLRRG